MGDRLRDKIALVVGAGSRGPGWGNGKAAAVVFAREGAAVFGADINLGAAEETRSIIEGEGGVCVAHAADATSSDSVAAMVAACLDRFGRIDVLHNNVGAAAPGGPVEMPEEVWDANIDVNLKTAFLTCKHVLPVMVAQGGGVIVNVASIAGVRNLERSLVSYQAGKAGLIQLGRSVAAQYGRNGIRCNSILPGLMLTPLVQDRIDNQYPTAAAREAALAERHEMVPMGRMGDAWDVAYAALYLACDESRYVTATELVVDGGLIAGRAAPRGDDA